MTIVYERHTLTALLILDLEDAFARSRGRPGEHPRPFEPLRFFLVERDILGTVTKFDPPIELEMLRNGSGYHLFFGQQKIYGPRGEKSTRRLELPPGTYNLRVTSPLYQTAEKAFGLPIGNANDPNIISNYHMDLEPSFAYPFPDVYPLGQETAGNCTNGNFSPRRGTTLLRGVLLDTDGQGSAGASVRVANRTNTYTTASSGQWVLWFREPQPTGPVELLIKFPNQATEEHVRDVCVVQGHETSLHQTALRSWVRKGASPLAGAIIRVQDLRQAITSSRDGSWTYVFPFTHTAQSVTIHVAAAGLPGQSRTVTLIPRATRVLDPFQF